MPKPPVLIVLMLIIVVTGGRASVQPTLAQPATPILIDALAWSPDGQSIAYTQIESDAYRHSLWRLDVAKRQVSQLAAAAPDVFLPQWSADCTQVGFISLVDPISVGVVSVDGSFYLDLSRDYGTFLPKLAWSPTENWLAGIETEQGDLWLLRPLDPINLTWDVDWPVTDFKWSPDGSTLVFGTGTMTTLLKVDVHTGEVEMLRQIATRQRSLFPDWTPDGSMISYVIAEDETSAGLWVSDTTTGAHKRIYSGLTRQPIWANQTMQVLVPTQAGWLILDSEGEQVAFFEVPPNAQFRGWSPDDHLILYQFANGQGTEQTRMLDVATQTVVDEGDGSMATFAPDGATIAYVEYVNRSVYLSLYTVADGSRQRLLEIKP